MRRTLVLAFAALALLGVVTPDAFAQAPAAAAPTPKFTINGLFDNLGTYTRNMSAFDNNFARNSDAQLYGRIRGRLDFIGEYGKAKAVLGIEIDEYYGQTGFIDSNNGPGCVTASSGAVTCGATGSGAEGSFDLNTDTQGILQIKWLYTEFEAPLIPVPTVVRLGGQPFGSAANYKLAAYANGDFAGVNVVSTLTPNVKLQLTYVAVEELLTGKKDIAGFTTSAGTIQPQSRGDDFAIIVSPEVTPFKGLDVKPMYSYFFASGVTNGSARTARGGFSTASGGPFAPATVSGADSVGTGVHESRQTVGLDARWRSGPFSLDPTILYQFGSRDAFNTVTPAYGILCNAISNPGLNCVKHEAKINAWLIDIRPGFQVGPLLLEGLFMWTSGNRASDTLFRHVNFFQPLDTDTSYLNGWGTQITSLGVDYYQGAVRGMGVAIGYDKYGRQQVGAKATYALTPDLSFFVDGAKLWTDKSVDTDSTAVNGLTPSFVDRRTGRSARPEGDSRDLGVELDAGLTWRFAPGLVFDWAVGYLFAGQALGVRHPAAVYCEAGKVNAANCQPPDQKDGRANDVLITTARVRFTF